MNSENIILTFCICNLQNLCEAIECRIYHLRNIRVCVGLHKHATHIARSSCDLYMKIISPSNYSSASPDTCLRRLEITPKEPGPHNGRIKVMMTFFSRGWEDRHGHDFVMCGTMMIIPLGRSRKR